MRVQIVSFRCVLKNNLGQLISSSTNNDVVTSGQTEKDASALPGFINALQGLKAGEKKRIYVAAENGYGFYNPDLEVQMARADLNRGKQLKVDDSVTGRMTEDGVKRTFRVVSTTKDDVVLDGNHPLAGQDLVFDVEMTDSHEENDQDPIEFATKSKPQILM